MKRLVEVIQVMMLVILVGYDEYQFNLNVQEELLLN